MTSSRKIVFVVNTVGMTGGVRVVFEYANRFKRDGFETEIIHLLKLKAGWKGAIVAAVKKIKWLLTGDNNIKWFDVNVPISHRLSLKNLECDVLIATAYETAKPVSDLESDAKKIYFIQGYESWGGAEADKTYSLPLERIAVSTFLKDLLEKKFSAESEVSTPGIELNKFNVKVKKFNDDKVISMLYHTLKEKGVDIGLEAVAKIQKKHPEIKLELFGMYPKPFGLPRNTFYTRDPSRKKLRKIYETSDIFVMPSRMEGFGLTAVEAMAAGCALITAETGGFADFSEDGKSAIWVEPADIEAMANALTDLIEDEDKLKCIAKTGQKEARKFTIDRAYENFKKLVLSE